MINGRMILLSAGAILVSALAIGVPAAATGSGVQPDTDVNVPGELVKALQVVLAARSKDETLSAAEKDILNFDVHMGPFSRGYEIIFDPRVAEGEVRKPGGSTSRGRSFKYGVDRDYKILFKGRFK